MNLKLSRIQIYLILPHNFCTSMSILRRSNPVCKDINRGSPVQPDSDPLFFETIDPLMDDWLHLLQETEHKAGIPSFQ